MAMLRTPRLAGAVLLAVALLPAAPALGSSHTVAPGETLWGIALSNGLSPGAVAAATVATGGSAASPRPSTAPAAAPAGTAAASSTSSTGAAGGVRVRFGDT